jgi:DNA polymerase-3 subunit gamma/tau
MGQALYRKYRSKSLAEIVGQEHITSTLSQALKSGRISHAYLFTGPWGVGKTSIARILAHELNGLPYDEGQSHLDIIEIDAASNNGVEDVRDLREKVYVAPTSGKYKVYIIDEVHMLSKAAFNALLKTLEEPPAHVVFILATTESHKLPDTIISRTQRFLFRPIEPALAVEHLRAIAKKEKITVDDEALALLAAHGDGSFRDSIGLLDQASGLGEAITVASVQSLLGIPPAPAIEAIAQALTTTTATVADVLSQLHQLYEQGFQATAIAKGLSSALREMAIDPKFSGDLRTLTALLAKLLDVPSSHDPERFLEICLLEAAAGISRPAPAVPVAAAPITPVAPAVVTPKAPSLATAPKVTPQPIVTPPAKVVAVPDTPPSPASPPAPEVVADTAPNGNASVDEALWNDVLNELKKQYNTLYGVARMAKPDFSTPGKLILACSFAFHQKRLHEAKNRQLISDIIERLSGQAIEVVPTHDPDLKLAGKASTVADKAPETTGDAPLSTISNIFGGGELLQS